MNLGGTVTAMWDRLPACPGCKVGGQNRFASPGRSPATSSDTTHAVIVCIGSIRDRLEAYPTLPAASAHADTPPRNDNALLMRQPCPPALTAGTAVFRYGFGARFFWRYSGYLLRSWFSSRFTSGAFPSFV